jgi:FkbM family methyltransferase
MMMDLSQIQKHFTPSSILDIGANTGQFYHECKQVFPNASYFLIEGNRECESALSQLGVPYEIALLFYHETTLKYWTRIHEPRCTGNSIYRELTHFYTDDQVKVDHLQTTTLNKLMEAHKIKRFDLVKIDTQGSELDILTGGSYVCREALGILLEVSEKPYNQDAPLKDEVIDYMRDYGFTATCCLSFNHHQQADILFLNNKYF